MKMVMTSDLREEQKEAKSKYASKSAEMSLEEAHGFKPKIKERKDGTAEGTVEEL